MPVPVPEPVPLALPSALRWLLHTRAAATAAAAAACFAASASPALASPPAPARQGRPPKSLGPRPTSLAHASNAQFQLACPASPRKSSQRPLVCAASSASACFCLCHPADWPPAPGLPPSSRRPSHWIALRSAAPFSRRHLALAYARRWAAPTTKHIHHTHYPPPLSPPRRPPRGDRGMS